MYKKYKLIKAYPGFSKLGIIVDTDPVFIFANSYHNVPDDLKDHPEYWEEQIEKEYEILPTLSKTIYSVKRLSDNEIFTIGDNTNFGIIKEFKIGISEKIWVFFTIYSKCKLLKEITLAKPLFITEDGIKKFEGDRYYYLRLHSWTFNEATVNAEFYNQDKYSNNSLYFSTFKAAEDYIVMNKPCLSINDVATIYSTAATEKLDSPKHQGNRIRELVKSKL